MASGAAWLPPTDLSDAFSDNQRQVLATDASGAAQVVWVINTPSTERLVTRRVGADGTLGPVMSLDDGSIGIPRISMDPAGTSIIIWIDGTTLNFIRLDANGDPLAPFAPVHTAAGGQPNVVMDEDGNATVVWTESEVVGSDVVVELRYSRIPAGGAPTAPDTFFIQPGPNNGSIGSVVGPIALGVDPGGVVTAGWVDRLVKTAFDNNARVIHIDPVAGPDPTPTDLDAFTTTSASAMQLGVDTSGDAVALWRNVGFWRAQQFHADDTLGTPHDLSTAGAGLGDATISVQPDGSAVIGWVESILGTVAQRLLANDTLAPSQILNADEVSDLTSALTNGGGTVFAWAHDDGGFDVVESRRLDSSDVLSPTDTPLSDPSSDAENLMAAGTPGGQPSILWDWINPAGGQIVQLTYFDAAPPLIGSLAGPSSASPGQQLTFAASATDRSGIAGFNWDFGDGGGAAGPIVQHSYAAPGSFPVTLTVPDNAGNQSEGQLLVAVSAPGGGGGGSVGITPDAVGITPFTVGGLDGRDLLVNLPSAGIVNVSNAGAKRASKGAVAAKKKKRRRGKRKLRPASATGGPGVVRVRLRLTKSAKRKLKRKRKLGVGAVIAFTPNGGATTTQVKRVRLRRGR